MDSCRSVLPPLWGWFRQTVILRLTTLGGAKTVVVVVVFLFCQFTHFTTSKFCSVQVCAIEKAELPYVHTECLTLWFLCDCVHEH